jgi:hypothetical protein
MLHSALQRLLVGLLVLAFSGFGVAQKKTAPPPPPRGEELEELGLFFDFPDGFAAERQAVREKSQVVAAWTGKCGSSSFRLGVRLLPADQFHLDEPLSVSELVLQNERRDRPNFAFDEQRILAGRFGLAPHAILTRALLSEAGSTKTSGVRFNVCGVVDAGGYVVELAIEPLPDTATLASVTEFLSKGITWKGTPRNARWTDEEAAARWAKDSPELKKIEKGKLLRTEHYIILTNASGGKTFGEKMEECYDAIKATYPFEETPGERLMPVFLFRTPDEYHAFFMRQFEAPLEQARRSKGVASGDFYATWYEAPKDPVHIHEATHQIFGNRLRLRGGGSWFQEGVAEYMSTSDNDRNTAARTVKRERQLPLAEFVVIQSLLFSSKEDAKSGADASSQYELAAFLIEFLRESKFSKDKFPAWLRAVGRTPRNDVAAIEAATRETLGVSLAELDAEWVEYATKR